MVRLTALAIAFVVVLGAFAGVAIWMLKDLALVPPQTLTNTRIANLERRLLLHARAHNSLPATLQQLDPDPQASKDALLDAWGAPLSYTVSPEFAVTLSSLGADHAPGGKGNNTDIESTFTAKRANGEWSDPSAVRQLRTTQPAATQP